MQIYFFSSSGVYYWRKFYFFIFELAVDAHTCCLQLCAYSQVNATNPNKWRVSCESMTLMLNFVLLFFFLKKCEREKSDASVYRSKVTSDVIDMTWDISSRDKVPESIISNQLYLLFWKTDFTKMANCFSLFFSVTCQKKGQPSELVVTPGSNMILW